MPTHEDTMQLITKAKLGCEESKTLLIQQNSPLVKSIIKRYRNKGVEYDDLYQLGLLGLIKAVQKFDTSFGVRFSTYAVPLIAGEVKRFLRDDGYIKVSRAVKGLYIKIKKYLALKGEESPSIDEIAKEFGVSSEEVVYAMDASRYPVSLFDKSGVDDGISLIERIPTNESEDKSINKIMLKEVLNTMGEREKKIIMLRYFRNYTQSQVAQVLNVSQVQVSRIEAKLLLQLKNYFNAETKKA